MTLAHSATPARAGHHEHGTAGHRRGAAPRVLVPALMDLVIGRIELARNCSPHSDSQVALIEEARTIIGALRDTLDLCDVGLAANLHDVYDYMCRQLGSALRGGRGSQLSEVAHLMHEVRRAWFALPHRAAPRPG